MDYLRYFSPSVLDWVPRCLLHFPGYPLDGPLDHYPAYEPLAGFGSLPRFYSLCGLLGFPGTPRALRDNGPLPLLFYGFCGTYGPSPLGILRVLTAIGPLGHSMAPISFLRLRVTLFKR